MGYDPASERMNRRRETQDPIEHSDAENVEHSAPASNLRKRAVAVFVIVTSWLMSSVATYYKCTYPGNTDWRCFAGYETIIGVFVIFCIVQVVRQTKKS